MVDNYRKEMDAFKKYVSTGRRSKSLKTDEFCNVKAPEKLVANTLKSANKNSTVASLAQVRTISMRPFVTCTTISNFTGWGPAVEGAPEPVKENKIDENKLNPESSYIYLEDLGVMTKFGEDEAADLSIARSIFDSIGRMLASKMDDTFVCGYGHACSTPDGILARAGLLEPLPPTDPEELEHWTEPHIPHDIYGAEYKGPVDAKAIEVLIGQLPTEYRNNAVVFMGRESFNKLFKRNQKKVIAGRPVKVIDPSDPRAKGYVIVGDPKKYRIIETLEALVYRSGEYYAAYGLVGLTTRMRIGGGITEPKAFRAALFRGE
jgi:HK97 family phage major capsid protein